MHVLVLLQPLEHENLVVAVVSEDHAGARVLHHLVQEILVLLQLENRELRRLVVLETGLQEVLPVLQAVRLVDQKGDLQN